MSNLDERVDQLRREGRYREAADLCLGAGEARRASELLAAVWDWDAAVDMAIRAGLFDLAYQHALAGELRDAARALLSTLADHPEQALRAAAHAENRGRLLDAARLREAAAEVDEAAILYERAGELFEAARCRESMGRYRDAGILYERRVREAPDDAEAALRLGGILAHFGRHDHAVRALQKAAEDPDRRRPALRLMVACFHAMGMDGAAASRLDELRRSDSSLPVTVPEYLEEQLGDARGLVAPEAGEGSEQLLAGRYRVLRPLGAGGTGRVLLARDGVYDRDVAVKVLTVGSVGAGRDAYARFAREARVAAGLDHPNVVRVFEFNPDGPFLVMEYMPGGTLEDRLEEGGGFVPLAVARHVLVSVLTGLEAVHRRGVVHRDLKPANIFFGPAGDVKIGDFGVAHLADLGATLTGAMLGTLAYMAPEQITGSERPDASTDLYAVGVILHRMLTSRLPFPGPDFVTQHLSSAPPLPSEVAPHLGTRFDGLVGALLQKEMATRPHTTGEVRALAEALSWTPADERAVEVATGVRAPRGGEAPSESEPPPAERFTILAAPAGGPALAQDAALERPVLLEACDASRAERLRRLAAVDGPFLQAVYDVDPETGAAILERPAGLPLTESGLAAAPRKRALAQVRSALLHMHALGVVHGAVSAERVRVGPGRAVLLLPPGSDAPGDPSVDLEALARLQG